MPSAESGLEAYVDVGAAAELLMEQPWARVVNGRRVLVCRTEEGVFVLADLCPHAHQPLSGGAVANGTIRCPRHGACFDIATGQPTNTVTNQPVVTYPSRVRGGRVEVSVPPLRAGFMPDFRMGGR